MPRRRPPWFKIALGVYLTLLGASYLVRHFRAVPVLDDYTVVRLREVGGDGSLLDSVVPVSYLEWGHAFRGQAPTVVLIHGSPGDAGNFTGLGALLGETRHVIALDLPGFGHLRTLPESVSARAHAGYVAQLVAELEIERVHVVGFSLGGVVASHLADPAESLPFATESLTLLAATGVQQFELFGNYQINHAVHGLQLAGLWLIHNAIPHFGYFDDSFLSVGYARNFFETDQRPVRAIFERLEVPTLVIHGKGDDLVPIEAAEEHHRIIPHSDLVLLDRNHFFVFMEPQMSVEPLEEFLTRVESRKARTRTQATNERVRLAEAPLTKKLGPARGLTLFTLVCLIAVGTWISEDLATIGAGLLAGDGQIGFIAASGAALTGIVTGDLAIYGAGRWLGPSILRRFPMRWLLPPKRVERAQQVFKKQGPWVIFASRFTPGTRVATYFAAGLLQVGAFRFFLYLLGAAALWVPALVFVAASIGDPIFDLMERFRSGGWILALVAVAIPWWLAHNLPWLLRAEGRARFRARWARRLRWEFLPSWVLYGPLIPYLAALALRHRGLTFTASNPGLIDGGLVGESKSALLRRIPSDAQPPFTVVHPELDPQAAVVDALAFFSQHGPLVLKPDIGERGRDVVVCRGKDEVRAHLRDRTETTICQKYVSGEEFGIFWAEEHHGDTGRLISVAQKHLPEVVGDGKNNLRDLILGHQRARLHADRFLADHSGEDTPEAGEVVSLGDLGTHCRGATFTDDRELITPQLAAAITDISREAELGFGRYDLRCPSSDHLRQGQGLQVLEFNGVSGEAAHLYDPKASLWQAYRTLADQWKTAFSVGARFRDQGVPTLSLAKFLAHVLRQLSARSSQGRHSAATSSASSDARSSEG